jgi:hypothetical protein
MANLIAKLGLDSREFKAGLNSAKAATGGFQSTIKTATNSMRDMFNVVLAPVAVLTAAVMLARKGFQMLDDVAKAAGDSMRSAVLGDVETSLERIKEKVDDARNAWKELSDQQSIVSSGIEKRAVLAEDLANAGKPDSGSASASRIAKLQREADAKLESSALKAQRGFQAKDQAAEVRKEYENAMSQAGKLRAEARTGGVQVESYGPEFGKTLKGIIQQKMPGMEEAQAFNKVADEIEKKGREALRVAKSLESESRQMERESLVDSAAVANAEKRINIERLNEQARYAKENFAMLVEINERNKELAAQDEMDKREKSAAASRNADSLRSIRGRGLDADSMARVGGFLGGERPGLAVADKQLQVAKEQLDLAKETHKEQRAATGYLQRLVGGNAVDPLM